MSTRTLLRAALTGAVFALLAAAVAFAQAAAGDQERRLVLNGSTSPQQAQSILNIIRSVGDIRQAALDEAGRAITVRGTTAQLVVGAWLLDEIDSPAEALTVRTLPVPEASDDIVRVLHIPNVNAQALQEIVNASRVVFDVPRMMAYNPSTMVLRGTAGQADGVEWMVRAFIEPQPEAATAAYEFRVPPPAGRITPFRDETAVRVLYFRNIESPRSLQEVAAVMRTISSVQRIMAYMQRNMIAFRGTQAQAALAEWLAAELDKPASPAANRPPREYPLPFDGDTVRIISPPARNAQEFQTLVNKMRTAVDIQRLMGSYSKDAIVLRGTTEQLNAAEAAVR